MELRENEPNPFLKFSRFKDGIRALGEPRLDQLLTYLLAVYVIRRSHEPTHDVIQDLFKIEMQAASFVSMYFNQWQNHKNLGGTLSSVFTLIPFGRRNFQKRQSAVKGKTVSRASASGVKHLAKSKVARKKLPQNKNLHTNGLYSK